MVVKSMDLASLVPYERNPRKRPKEAVAAVAASLKKFGWQQPIVVDSKNVISVGHTRHAAALSLGWTTAPVVVIPDDQAAAYRLVDNRSGEFTVWDNDLLRAELDSCAPGFSWTLDCERVTRRRRVEMGKPDQDSAAAEGARRAIGDAAGSGRGGRFSVGRKRAVVLRLLRGEDLESVSRAVGITAARASQWRERFLAAGQASLKSRAPDARDDDNRRLQAKIGELLMENELLDAKVDQLEAGGPLARRRSRR